MRLWKRRRLHKRRTQAKALAMTEHYEFTKEGKKNERYLVAGLCTAGCFFVSFVFLHGACFQAVNRNIAHRKFICISGFIFPLCGAGRFGHYFTVAEESSAGSGASLAGAFIPHFYCGISGIQTV